MEALISLVTTLTTDWREAVFLALMTAMVLGMLWVERRTRERQSEVRQVWYPTRPIAGPRLAPGADATAEAVLQAIKAQDWAMAHQMLRLADLEGPSPWHTFHLGLVLHRQGFLPEAEWYYRHTLEQAHDHRDAAYNLGILLQETERPTAAMGAYRQALEVFPEDADVLFNLGHVYFQLRLYQQAYRCWLAAAKLDPGARDTRNNLRLLRGMRQALKTAPVAG